MTPSSRASIASTPRANEAIAATRQWISQHPLFRGRADQFSIDAASGQVVVEGRVPSFHLRRVLVDWLHKCDRSPPVLCRIEVISPFGLSGCSPETRRRCALEFEWLGKAQRCFETCTLTPGRYVEDAAPPS